MIVATRELIGKPLNWAVTMLDGRYNPERAWARVRTHKLSPSTNWGHGGPIIQRLGIGIREPTDDVGVMASKGGLYAFGPDALIAAMRCAVLREFGDSIDVPTPSKGKKRIVVDLDEVARLSRTGLKRPEIAARLNVGVRTLQRNLREAS